MASERIRWMDGLRGIAILLVVLYHLYGPGDSVTGPTYWLFTWGWVGVELFFLISGFVILMTLERCRSMAEFTWRRWLRLFPAMFVGSLVILSYDHLVGVGPFEPRSAANLIPGFLFISPSLIHTVTRMHIPDMDTSYWSLYVEVFFYAIFGTAFFAFGWRWAIAVILALFGISYGITTLHFSAHSLGGHIASATDWMGSIYFCWFAAGALFYRASRGEPKMFLGASLLAVVAVFTQKIYVGTLLPSVPYLLLVCALFTCAQRSVVLQRLLAARSLVFLGFVSYPLYLIHQGICIGLTEILGERFAAVPRWLVPLPSIALVVLVSWLIAEYAEPRIRSIFRNGKRVETMSVT